MAKTSLKMAIDHLYQFLKREIEFGNIITKKHDNLIKEYEVYKALGNKEVFKRHEELYKIVKKYIIKKDINPMFVSTDNVLSTTEHILDNYKFALSKHKKKHGKDKLHKKANIIRFIKANIDVEKDNISEADIKLIIDNYKNIGKIKDPSPILCLIALTLNNKAIRYIKLNEDNKLSAWK